jgi:ribosomal-protein-alanine N-acetyltransferase
MNRPGDTAPDPEFKIKPAGWRDVQDVFKLERTCFKQDAWPIWDVVGVLTFPEMVRLKAVLDGELIGFIAGDQRSSRGEAWIATLAVLPAFRRRGTATRLLAACEKQLDVPVIKLSVRAGNRPAVLLYRRRGYQLTGIWPGYYRGNQDALIFQKTRSPSRTRPAD